MARALDTRPFVNPTPSARPPVVSYARIFSAIVFCAIILTAFAASARSQPPRQSGSQMNQPATQSFHDAVAEAWAHLPQRRDLAAQQATMAARYMAGGSLFPKAPLANGSYVNDHVAGSNYNYVTTQLELSTPVWLPGEGTATRNTAQADAVAVEAVVEAAHLALAVQLLDLAARRHSRPMRATLPADA